MTWRPVDLGNQFRRASALNWIAAFKEWAEHYSFPPEILVAIGSRETNLRNIIGDGGHGHGIMQIDDRSFPAWCQGKRWQSAIEAIRMGAYVLSTKRERAINKKVPDKDALRVALASYNAGDHAIQDYFHHGNPDLRTTGHDYSADVLKRAEEFKKLLLK